MARRAAATATMELPVPAVKPPSKFLRNLQTVCNWTLAIGILVGCLFAAWQIEQFVLADNRFILQGPPEPGVASDYFQITGTVHASEQHITEVFHTRFRPQRLSVPHRRAPSQAAGGGLGEGSHRQPCVAESHQRPNCRTRPCGIRADSGT